MKLRKTLSTLLAAALMVGMLVVPSMAASPMKVTGGSYYNTISLSSALNEGTAMLGVYGSTEGARPVRVYTVQAGTVLTTTGDYYIEAHPVTLMPDGTYEIKSVVSLYNADGSRRVSSDPGAAPEYKTLNEKSENWRSWTWYTPEYFHDYSAAIDHLLPTHISQTHYSTLALNNSHAGTWMLRGGEVILKVIPVETSSKSTAISVYQVTSGSGLNVRAGAGTNYAKVGHMANGTQFEVVTASINNGWGQLTNGNWVWLNGAKFIRYKDACGVIGRQDNLWTVANTFRVVSNGLAIHDGPADSHAVVGNVARGTLIDITEYYGEDWGFLANEQGWVRLGVNGNRANVQFAEIKKISTSSVVDTTTTPNNKVPATIEVFAGKGLVEVRERPSFDAAVIGYVAPQGVTTRLQLASVYNDWGRLGNTGDLASDGYIYLPYTGNLNMVDILPLGPSI